MERRLARAGERPHAKVELLAMAAAVAGSGFVLAALVLQPGRPRPVEILLILGVALIAAALAARQAGVAPRNSEPMSTDRPAANLEQLSDMRWQVSESEARYRDLLDAQSALIGRRDTDGRLTYVNRAFCRTFAVEEGSVIGSTFRPRMLADAPGLGLSGRSPSTGNERLELNETRAGERWIAWSEHAIADRRGMPGEIQFTGRDVTDQHLAGLAVAAARDKALRATEAKSRFLARMSHEIRTPMGGVLGMANLLAETQLSSEQGVYVNAIEQSARTLLTLVNEILDLAKVEADRLEVDMQPMSVTECVQSVVELLAPQAYQKGIEIAWSLGSNVPHTIVSDELRCRQILLNLVGNAIKFTAHGGVRIAVGADGTGGLTVEVHDTGPGIPAEERERVFDEFEQSSTNDAARHAGAGLGLAISRHLARALGGNLALSDAAGQGCCFALTLPGNSSETAVPTAATSPPDGPRRPVLIALDRPIEAEAIALTLAGAGIHAERTYTDMINARLAAGRCFSAIIVEARAGIAVIAELLARAREQAGAGVVRGIAIIEAGERNRLPELRAAGFDAYLVRPVRPQSALTYLQALPSEIAPATSEAKAADPVASKSGEIVRRALLVEDNDINALLTTRLLEPHGVEARRARTGLEALAAVKTWPRPDIILMDINLPGIDGVETTRLIREHYEAAGIATPPVIALTAGAFADDRRRCLTGGLDDFLAKPFERHELERLLEKWCGTCEAGSRHGALAKATHTAA